MDCRKVMDMILTGYIDGELPAGLKEQVAAHIASCEKCRLFEADVRKIAVEPFEGVKKETPPEAVWANIKAALDKKAEKRTFGEILSENLKDILRVPGIVYAAGVVTIAAFAVLVILNAPFIKEKEVRRTGQAAQSTSQAVHTAKDRKGGDSYLKEQMDFIIMLQNNDNTVVTDSSNSDIGAFVEEMIIR